MLADHGIVRKFYRHEHEVSPGKLWRSYQPSPRDLERWRKRGIRTVVNLRGPKPSPSLALETEACDALGLRLVNFRAFSREAPSADFLKGLRALYREIEYPALIHCKSGADRAGLAAALFLFFEEARPLDAALEQLSLRYGHVKGAKTGVIDAAFEAYLRYAEDRGIALDDVDAFLAWVEGPYDPAAIKRAYSPRPLATLIADVALRRE